MNGIVKLASVDGQEVVPGEEKNETASVDPLTPPESAPTPNLSFWDRLMKPFRYSSPAKNDGRAEALEALHARTEAFTPAPINPEPLKKEKTEAPDLAVLTDYQDKIQEAMEEISSAMETQSPDVQARWVGYSQTMRSSWETIKSTYLYTRRSIYSTLSRVDRKRQEDKADQRLAVSFKELMGRLAEFKENPGKSMVQKRPKKESEQSPQVHVQQ